MAAGGNDNTGGGGGPGATCGVTGSLDYSIDFRDKSILPKDEFAIQDQVVARWPAAALYNWSKIVSRSIDAGWNPSFILALWIEESGAQGEPGYTDALGCDPKHPTKDIDKSLTCVFNSFKDTSGFEDLMCLYGGDGFHKAPCTFNMENPNFPGGVKDWYLKLAGGITNGSKDSNSCLPSQPGDWPTEGTVYQGPKGASDHARLYDQGLEAIDIANASGPPVYTSFDGVANAHGCITEYGDCGVHYGNFVDVVSNNGAFTVRYGHLSQFSISDGQSVKAGDQIGIMGSTGASTGTHLHWEFRGIKMEPPNIPQAIEPFNCDNDLGPSCGNPSSVIRGSPSQPGV